MLIGYATRSYSVVIVSSLADCELAFSSVCKEDLDKVLNDEKRIFSVHI